VGTICRRRKKRERSAATAASLERRLLKKGAFDIQPKKDLTSEGRQPLDSSRQGIRRKEKGATDGK